MLEKVVENKYSLGAPSYQCSGCSRETPRGEPYFSSILFQKDAFERRELCPGCWEKGTVDREAMFAFWLSRRPLPEAGPPTKRRFDIELVWSFFQNLERDLAAARDATGPDADAEIAELADDVDDAVEETVDGGEVAESPGGEAPLPYAQKERLCFLLALLLVRGKKLVLDSSAVRDGREWLRLREKGNPDCEHLVADPRLGREDLERVKEQLGDLLQMEL